MLNPAQFHPNIAFYRDGGMGGVGEDKSVTGYVRTSLLRSMPGNDTNPERVEHYRQLLRSGQGFENPVMVEFDPKRSQAYVGEGNHRVEAAHQGHEYVPTRVVRSRIDDFNDKVVRHQGGQVGQLPPRESQWKGHLGEEYWPPMIHPAHVFPDEHVWKG
jgi:hypothetical protein